MGGRYLLDTNVLVQLFNGSAEVGRRLENTVEVLVPTVVLGELLFGAERSARKSENVSRIEDFSTACTVLVIDQETARKYAQVKEALHRAGRPIPDNDVWIAAIALQHGLVLATRDRHFGHVEGLATESW